MGWAADYIKQLQQGKTVQFRPRGNSMTGKVNDGQLVTVEPIEDKEKLAVDDVVLCKVAHAEYLHLIKAIGMEYGRRVFLIGNNKGRTNGWTTGLKIYGKLTKVED